MPNSSNIEIIGKWYSTHDPALLSPECVWEIAEGFPGGGTYTSSQVVVEGFFPNLLGAFQSFNAEVDEILDANSVVLGLGHYRGQTKATCTKVNVPFAHLWKVNNSRIVWFRNFTDTLLIDRALQVGQKA